MDVSHKRPQDYERNIVLNMWLRVKNCNHDIFIAAKCAGETFSCTDCPIVTNEDPKKKPVLQPCNELCVDDPHVDEGSSQCKSMLTFPITMLATYIYI